MKEIKIEIGSKEYTVKLAESDEDHDKGLQGVTELPENEGMLFIFSEPDEISFYMKDTHIPLDIIFIDEEMNVISVHEGVPESEDLITEQNVMYVLELNKDSGVKEGDELEFKPDSKLKSDKMHVLDAEGNSQMELVGGERIFSRKHTKTLVKFAKKAAMTNNDNDYKALGKRMFKFLQVQSETDPEYVKSKN